MNRAEPAGLAIVGATATGKTDLAVAVARRLDGEIIGVDSRQAYHGMAVGTAAPREDQLSAVPHHGIGFLDPREAYSAESFARRARAWIDAIAGRGRVPILVGGTGFFLRALLQPVFTEPVLDPQRRLQLRRWLARQSASEVRRWARRLDPEWSVRVAVVDRQRAGRAIELAVLSGRSLSWWHKRAEPAAEPVVLRVFALFLPPEVHRARIRARVKRQLDEGWPEELHALRAAGVPEEAPALNAVGYREVAALVAGRLARAEAIEAIVRRSWAYARRQRTWFRHQLPGLTWLDATEPIEHLAALVEREWSER